MSRRAAGGGMIVQHGPTNRTTSGSAAPAGTTPTGGRPSIRRGCRRGAGSSTTPQLFGTVEVNNTFYRLPSRDAVANWAAQTPPGLRVRRQGKPLPDAHQAPDDPRPKGGSASTSASSRWSRRASSARSCGSCRRTSTATWSGSRPRSNSSRRAGTASSSATRAGSTTRSTRPCGAAVRRWSWATIPSGPFQTHELTADWTFVRFHHGSRGRNGNYSKTELEAWSRRIAQWRRNGRRVRVLQQRLARLRGAQRTRAAAPAGAQ